MRYIWEVGDVVEIAETSEWWGEGEHNPIHTRGFVVALPTEGLSVKVLWDRSPSMVNCYDHHDLVPFNSLREWAKDVSVEEIEDFYMLRHPDMGECGVGGSLVQKNKQMLLLRTSLGVAAASGYIEGVELEEEQ